MLQAGHAARRARGAEGVGVLPRPRAGESDGHAGLRLERLLLRNLSPMQLAAISDGPLTTSTQRLLRNLRALRPSITTRGAVRRMQNTREQM